MASDEGRDSTAASTFVLSENDEPSLLDILDHVLHSGLVIHGSLIISLAGVDLVYVGLNVILTSVETAVRNLDRPLPTPARRSGRKAW
jgi:hypothetical protein